MAKINSTYDAGYFIPDDIDYRKLPKDDGQVRRETERQAKIDRRRAERNAKRTGPAAEGDDAESGSALPTAAAVEDIAAGPSSRRTFMIEFPTICDACEQLIGRGTKVYALTTKLKEKYLGQIALFELKFRCPKCGEGEIVYRSDPATRSYVVHSGGRVAIGGGMEFDEMVKANDAAGAAAGEPDAEDEMTARIEKHQKAAMDAEAVDDEVASELRKMMFPPDDLIRAVRARHEAQLQQARDMQNTAAQGTALSDEDRASLRREFESLRSAKGFAPASSKSGGQASKRVSSDDPFAGLELADTMLDTHAAAIDAALKAMPQQSKSAVPAVTSSAAPAASSSTNNKSKLLGALFD